MNVKVQYTTQLKAAIGHAEESVELPDGGTLGDLLNSLCSKYPDAFAKLVVGESGDLHPSIILCIDDKQVSADASLALNDQSTVTFLSAISGG